MTKILRTSFLMITMTAVSNPAFANEEAGKATYDKACGVCHNSGVADSPKIGDLAAWAPRIETGIEALYASAINGKNGMPAKGGQTAIPDEEIKAAVDYLTKYSSRK